MKSDLDKNKLLKILSIQRNKKDTSLGLPYEYIENEMSINREYLDFISGELYGNEEIKFFEDYQYNKGLYITKIGISSYSSEKYKKLHKENVWNSRKNFAQTVLPVFSLIVAIMALGLAFVNSPSKHTEIPSNLEKKLEKLEYQITELESISAKNNGDEFLKTEKTSK